MDEQLKKMLEEIQRQKLAEVVQQPKMQAEQMQQELQRMPASIDRSEQMKNYINSLNNKAQENSINSDFKPENSVYAGSDENSMILSPREQAFKSLEGSSLDPNLNARPRIRKLLGK